MRWQSLWKPSWATRWKPHGKDDKEGREQGLESLIIVELSNHSGPSAYLWTALVQEK